jgi:lipopolysaccharide biosynthesis protein
MNYSKFVRTTFLPRSIKILDFFLGCGGQIFRLISLIRERWPGDDPASDSTLAAVYVHYDREGMVHDYVLHQLRELSSAGFRIVFVSNSPSFSKDTLALITPFCRTVLWRHNFGYDFGAYKDGLRAVGAFDQLNGLLLMNDSVYGPFFPLKDFLGKIDRSNVDFWGITDSWQHYFHIQSYFILFLPNALKSAAFKGFWRKLPYVSHKGWAIRNGEMKLSQTLTRQKLRAAAMVPYWSVSRTVLERLQGFAASEMPDHQKTHLKHTINLLVDGRALNPMHQFWDVMIEDYECPFIKRELLKYNPANVPMVSRWPDVIARACDYDISMIWRHLQT